MKEEEKDQMQLPENAFRELSEGESYQPIMRPDREYAEVNGWYACHDVEMHTSTSLSKEKHTATSGSATTWNTAACTPGESIWKNDD